MNCDLQPARAGFRCRCCGWTHTKELRRNCPKPCMRGLGDAVALLTKPIARALGLRDCGGCAERQKKLNALVPFHEK